MANRPYPVPMCWEGDGKYAVADCTQCGQPLCRLHAHNRYPHAPKPLTFGTIDKQYAYLRNLPDPSVHGIRIWVSLAANEKMLTEYGDRTVCRECHIANTTAEHTRILQSLSLPQLEAMTLFEFALFMLFSGYCFSLVDPAPAPLSPESRLPGPDCWLDATHVTEALDLTISHVIQGWLKIAAKEHIAPATTAFVESQTNRRQSSSQDMSGWHFVSERTDVYDWSVPLFTRNFITTDGHLYHLYGQMKGEEDYAPCRMRVVPSLWLEEEDAYPPGSMNNKSLLLFYGVAKRIAAQRGIAWRWVAPQVHAGVPPFCSLRREFW